MWIRAAKPDDVAELADLASRSVLGLSQHFYDSIQAQSAAECITTPDTDLIADETLFVAIIDDKIVGCGAWSKRKKLDTGSELDSNASAWLDPVTEPARIRAFFVDPKFARQGIAGKLYEVCRETAVAQGFKRFSLMATLPGVPFYQHLGFLTEESVDLNLLDGTQLPAVHMSILLIDVTDS